MNDSDIELDNDIELGNQVFDEMRISDDIKIFQTEASRLDEAEKEMFRSYFGTEQIYQMPTELFLFIKNSKASYIQAILNEMGEKPFSLLKVEGSHCASCASNVIDYRVKIITWISACELVDVMREVSSYCSPCFKPLYAIFWQSGEDITIRL